MAGLAYTGQDTRPCVVNTCNITIHASGVPSSAPSPRGRHTTAHCHIFHLTHRRSTITAAAEIQQGHLQWQEHQSDRQVIFNIRHFIRHQITTVAVSQGRQLNNKQQLSGVIAPEFTARLFTYDDIEDVRHLRVRVRARACACFLMHNQNDKIPDPSTTIKTQRRHPSSARQPMSSPDPTTAKSAVAWHHLRGTRTHSSNATRRALPTQPLLSMRYIYIIGPAMPAGHLQRCR